MAAEQRSGTKRKASELHSDEDTKRVVKQASSSDTKEVKAEAAPLDFCAEEFKKCLFMYLVERYQSRPEIVNGVASTTLEKYGTCVHPLDSTKMTLRPWARHYEMRRALETVFTGNSRRMRWFQEATATGDIASICADYVTSPQDLRRDMSVGLALLQKRFDSIIRHDFVMGYIGESCEFQVDNNDRQKMRVSRRWAEAILAHAKYKHADLIMGGEAWTQNGRQFATELFIDRDHVWVSKVRDGRWHQLPFDTLSECFPVRTLVTGFVRLWETDTDVPAPGVYTGVSPGLVALMRSVEPCATSARVLARAYSIERSSHNLVLVRNKEKFSVEAVYAPSLITSGLSRVCEIVSEKHTLDPALCLPLTDASLSEAQLECPAAD